MWNRWSSPLPLPGEPPQGQASSLMVRIATAVGVVLLLGMTTQLDSEQALSVISTVDLVWLSSAVSASLLATAFRALRFRLLIPPVGRVIDLVGAFSVMRIASIMLPFQSGQLVLLQHLKNRGLIRTIAGATPAWLLTRAGDVLALLTFFFITQVALAADLPGHVEILILVLVSCSVLVILSGLYWKCDGLPRMFRFVRHSPWLFSRLDDVAAGLKQISRGRIVGSLFASHGVWAAMVAVTVFSQIAFGSSLSWQNAILAAVLIQMCGLLPIHAPLQIGTGEATWVASMALAGLPVDDGVYVAVGIRIASLICLAFESGVGWLLVSQRQPLAGENAESSAFLQEARHVAE